ncbi:hypothetical protein BCR24_13145 [Enterococcus ureilyticus]|uniref:Gram-positive cocci surface proteins LPxTG domain-containing protein n=1 Tax=Enterococcus ureilyticus TaxID=1131292 RepID=A0A1E5HDS3_9ENTE|nr:LPXTG cell wall anchor domain-containing protein [Enterococcus ureilyticus]MBM7689831.1 LPXTG-motif cell wall-anchored protein [Enterococcus ureilyticus]OEG23092.1 hypothetical protein BCR24_13145 [Enterococcus ureilyticus]
MKKIAKKRFLFVSIFCLSLCLATFSTVYAEEIGQIQTKAGVGFYESSSSDSGTDTTNTTATSATSEAVTKPKGRYPSTGELVKTSLSISGLILVILVLILFLRKKKEKNTARRER